MEIKVIHTEESSTPFKAGDSTLVNPQVTYLFEGEDLMYAYQYYSNKDEFLKYYREHVGQLTATVIGISESYWDDDVIDNSSGEFIWIQFHPKGYEETPRVLILKDCKVFITNKGQTIEYLRN